MRNFFRSISYHIGPPSKLYEDNQATIKIALKDKITPQSRPLDFLITSLHELHLRNTFYTVDTRSNMQLADLNSKPYGGKVLINQIGSAIGAHFYPSIGSEHYKILFLDQIH